MARLPHQARPNANAPKPRHANFKQPTEKEQRASAEKVFTHQTGSTPVVPPDSEIDDEAMYNVVLSKPVEFGNYIHQPGAQCMFRGDFVKQHRESIVHAEHQDVPTYEEHLEATEAAKRKSAAGY